MPGLSRDVDDVAFLRFELSEPLDVVADGAQADQPELAAFLVEVALVARLRPLVVAHDDVGEAASVSDERAAAFFAGDDLAEIDERPILRVERARPAVDARLDVLEAGQRHRR